MSAFARVFCLWFVRTNSKHLIQTISILRAVIQWAYWKRAAGAVQQRTAT